MNAERVSRRLSRRKLLLEIGGYALGSAIPAVLVYVAGRSLQNVNSRINTPPQKRPEEVQSIPRI